MNDKDENMRAAAAEGLGRIRNPADRSAVDHAFTDEHKMSPRLADGVRAGFGLGNLDTSEFSPLGISINTLNVRSYRGVAVRT